MVEKLVLKRCGPMVVSKNDVEQVIPTPPTNVSPLWDSVTDGMSEPDKDKLRNWLREHTKHRSMVQTSILHAPLQEDNDT